MDLARRACRITYFSTNLLWLVKHDFPFLELMRNIRESGRDVARGPIAFIADQALIINPILFPLWVGGLLWLLFGKGAREIHAKNRGPYRILGWAYIVMLVTFIILKGKNYYLAPMYPILFASGAIAFERVTMRKKQTARAVGRSLGSHDPAEGVGNAASEPVHQPSAPAVCDGAGRFTSP